MSRVNLGDLVVANSTGLGSRNIETITGEILELKEQAGTAILEIGKRLTEAKAVLPHGEWLPWLNERVEFSERTAQNFMRLSREWTNPQALADLGATKALTLLALPTEEREAFLEDTTVAEMPSRELAQAIRERNEAREAAKGAELAMAEAQAAAKTAEDSRAKMAEDMDFAKKLLESVSEDKAKADSRVAELERELAALKAAPVDVAVMEVDQAALDKAKADAEAAMLDELTKAKEAKVKAEKRCKDAKEEVAELRERLTAAERSAKAAALTADKDMAAFEVLFGQGQELANKMQGLLIKARNREAVQVAETIQRAMLGIAKAIEEAAK